MYLAGFNKLWEKTEKCNEKMTNWQLNFFRPQLCSMRQNIIKNIKDVDIINQHNLTEIYRIFHTTTVKYLHGPSFSWELSREKQKE